MRKLMAACLVVLAGCSAQGKKAAENNELDKAAADAYVRAWVDSKAERRLIGTSKESTKLDEPKTLADYVLLTERHAAMGYADREEARPQVEKWLEQHKDLVKAPPV